MPRTLFALLVLVFASLIATGIAAQTTVTIGVQSAGNNYPFNYGTRGRYQTLYSAAEMALASGGTITEVQVWGSTLATLPTFNNFRLRLAHSTLTPLTTTANFDTNYSGTLATCLGPSNFQPTTTGALYYRFPLTTTFAYNGTQSILVDFSYDSRTSAGWLIDSNSSGVRRRTYADGGTFATVP